MSTRTTGFQRQIEREFAGTGLDYRIGATGKKHRKVYIDNRMVMVFSHGACCSRDLRLVKSIIRKAIEAKNADHPRPI